jgi:hypothetical protein
VALAAGLGESRPGRHIAEERCAVGGTVMMRPTSPVHGATQEEVDAAERDVAAAVFVRLRSERALAEIVHIAAARDAARARLEVALKRLDAVSRADAA